MTKNSGILDKTICTALTIMVILTFVTPVASAEPRSASGSAIKTDIAGWMVRQGAKAYFRVYDKWPESWAAVVDAGLVQAPLTAMYGGEVDPDDGNWDFDWDIQYLPPEGDQSAKHAVMNDFDGMVIRIDPISPVLSYAEWHASDEREVVQAALLDEQRLLQWAIGGMLQHSLMMYLTSYGELPATFDEYVSAGVTGIDSCSINPLTGDYFYGDGRPNDFEYLPMVDEETGEIIAISIRAVDENGDTPWQFSL